MVEGYDHEGEAGDSQADRQGERAQASGVEEKEESGMSGVVFDRKWEINTDDDFISAIKALDEDEFIANMSDSYARTAAEVAEVNRQRKEVILQAMEKGIISGRIDHGKEADGCQARSDCAV